MPVFNIALCFSGFILLALAMERHFETVIGASPRRAQSAMLKVGGWAALILAATRSIQSDGPSVGLAIWVGELGIAATLVALLLTYGSRRVVLAAFVVGLLAACFLG
jgi:hypothetical protein